MKKNEHIIGALSSIRINQEGMDSGFLSQSSNSISYVENVPENVNRMKLGPNPPNFKKFSKLYKNVKING